MDESGGQLETTHMIWGRRWLCTVRLRRLKPTLLSILAIVSLSSASNAATYHWRGNVLQLYATLDEACQASYQLLAWDRVGSCEYSTTFDYCEKQIIGTDPPSSATDLGNTIVHFTITSPFPESCGYPAQLAGPQWFFRAELVPEKYYVSASFSEQSQCDMTCNGVGDPINPATGAMFMTRSDIAFDYTNLEFKRFINSNEPHRDTPSGLFRHSFSRSVVKKYSTIEKQEYLQSAGNSSLYDDPEAACTSGFAEVRSRVPQWSDAIASYSDGNCHLTSNGASIGSLTVYTTANELATASGPVAYDVIRDDGQLIRFTVINGVITAPPGINLKLSQTEIGFTLADVDDTAERYDMNGKLVSVTSRTGVVQTVSYDSSGRLSSVADTFGHQLTLSYDGQGRVISVSRQ